MSDPPVSFSSKLREENKEDGRITPQFINLTDSVDLDKSARTKVRVQVMRNYHTQRVQKKKQPTRTLIRSDQKPILSAESQTRKFRFDEEKSLTPWVPVKSEAGKRLRKGLKVAALHDDVHPQKRRRKKLKKKQESGGDLISLSPLSSSKHQTRMVEIGTGSLVLPPEEFYFQGDGPKGKGSQERRESTLDPALRTPTLYQSVASGSLDPFASMPLPITPRTQLLLHHYFNDRLYSSWLMMPMRKGMLSLAMHDTALFHTFMSHYIARYNIRFHTGDPAESMHHRTEAISLINRKLADPNPSQALSDATIATVANMAVYESSNGRRSSLLVHLNGLVEMVNMRGGIQHGGFHPNVQRLLVWTDLHCSLALSARPRFPPVDMPLTQAPELFVPAPASNPSFPRQDIGRVGEDERDELDLVLAEINTISHTMRTIWSLSPTLPPPENIWYSDKIYYLQRSLYSIIHRPSSQNSSPETMITRTKLEEAGALAALIFCCHCLRDVHLGFRVIANTVTRLKSALEGIPLDMAPFNLGEEDITESLKFKKRIFWILALGGAASEGKGERGWFVSMFRAVNEGLGVREWEEARGVLEGVLWHPELEGVGGRFWGEVVAGTGREVWEIE